jgi:hypothetical protein
MEEKFHCFDWRGEDEKGFKIYAFSLTDSGKSVAIHVTHFKPFF